MIYKQNYPSFWPSEEEKIRQFGTLFSAELIDSTDLEGCQARTYRIHKKISSLPELMATMKLKPKLTQFFQVTCWPLETKTPLNEDICLEIMDQVAKWRQETNSGTVLVVSP